MKHVGMLAHSANPATSADHYNSQPIFLLSFSDINYECTHNIDVFLLQWN